MVNFMKEKHLLSDRWKKLDKYADYDEAYEDAAYEQGELLAKRRRLSKPKKDSTNLIAGLVVRGLGHHFEVQTSPQDDPAARPHKNMRLCEVRRRLRQEKTVDTLVAVGDRVWLVPEKENAGRIERVDERTTVLSRQRPGVDHLAEDVILANPDQVLVVFATADPEPHLRMLDRFLVVAEFNELPAILCVNKVDLVGLEAARRLFGLYESVGYTVLYTSVTTGEGIDQLRDLLANKMTALAGPSGVGKSSLINAIYPELALEVGDVSEFLHKGRHTTRAARLLPLPFGEDTYVADTPGIRELGLYDIDPADMAFYFIEMKPLVNECRYPNCTHDHEPGCAVRAAVARGEIAPERYDSYLRLMRGEE